MDGPKKARLSDLVDVIRQAATRDARAVYLGPKMLNATKGSTGGDAKKAQAVDLVRKWIRAGAHRRNTDGDENEDNGPAAAIFDAWYTDLVHKIFDDEIGADAYDLVPTPITDGDMWNDFSSFVVNLFSRKASRTYARPYCDNMTTPAKESCKAQVVQSLDDALAQLTTDQGEDPTAWTTAAWLSTFSSLGLSDALEMPWQNRGTHNHVVEIRREARSGPSGGGGNPTATPEPSP
jgi:acyl-homoserine lactone acylase PvdQ